MLRKRAIGFFGILNGIDYQEWNPETDPALPAHYSRQAPAGKFLCRQELLRYFGFDPRVKNRSLAGFRLARKGLTFWSKPGRNIKKRLLSHHSWDGEKHIQDMLIEAAKKYPENLALKIAFDDRL